MEASIEHLSRGTLRHVDVLLMIAEPYYRSLETLGRMAPLAAELGVPHRFVVANKVRTERDLAAIREYAERLGLELLGSVPYDEAVVEADHEGRAIFDYQPSAPAVRAIAQLVDGLFGGEAVAPTGGKRRTKAQSRTKGGAARGRSNQGKASVLRRGPQQQGCPWIEVP